MNKFAKDFIKALPKNLKKQIKNIKITITEENLQRGKDIEKFMKALHRAEEDARKTKVMVGVKLNKCWLCGKGRPNTTITVGCNVPNGRSTKVHDVRVHYGCYMDMDS